MAKEVTKYERARLRLEAFKVLEGWGIHDAQNDFRKWTYAERKANAIALADWATDDH